MEPPAASRVKRRTHPMFSFFYDAFSDPAERSLLSEERRKLLSGLRGDVLDLGCGTGANFPVFYELLKTEPKLRLHAVEPDPHMLRRAQKKAESLGLPIRFCAATAEDLPYTDSSFDYVISTLVLCTVTDSPQSLREVLRVLRPGGELRFLEHVRAEGARGWWQDRLRMPWSFLGGGCQLNRRTGDALRMAGYEEVVWETVSVPLPVFVVLRGSATRGK